MEARIDRYMTEQPHSVNPQVTLLKAKELMAHYNIRHLPVVENRKLVGLISSRDFTLVDLFPDLDLSHSKVEDIMMQDLYSVPKDALLKDVVRHLSQSKIGCVVVTDDKQEVKGIFTTTDALQLIHKLYDV